VAYYNASVVAVNAANVGVVSGFKKVFFLCKKIEDNFKRDGPKKMAQIHVALNMYVLWSQSYNF
jgi:hypothetical protein